MKTALLIIDMQLQFGRKILDPPVPQIQRLHKYFDGQGWPVIFTQHGHESSELQPPVKSQHILKLQRRDIAPIVVGTPEWDLIPEIADISTNCPIVRKNTYNAFQSGELGRLLAEQDVKRLVVTGVMTDVCCHITSVHAFMEDYETWLVNDACYTASQEQHESALKISKILIDHVMTCENAIERLEKEEAPCFSNLIDQVNGKAQH
jgi:nicotinamidase-related amidase